MFLVFIILIPEQSRAACAAPFGSIKSAILPLSAHNECISRAKSVKTYKTTACDNPLGYEKPEITKNRKTGYEISYMMRR